MLYVIVSAWDAGVNSCWVLESWNNIFCSWLYMVDKKEFEYGNYVREVIKTRILKRNQKPLKQFYTFL